MGGDPIKVDDSILMSVKKLLGMDPEEFDQYDADIMLHINTVIETLNQIGVDMPEGFYVSDKTALWSDYLNKSKYSEIKGSIKSYIFMKVRLIFDPPTNQSVINATNETIKELEWRIKRWVEFYDK